MRAQTMWVAVTGALLVLTPYGAGAGAQFSQQNVGRQQTTAPNTTVPRSTMPSITGESEVNLIDPTSTMREAQRYRAFANERQKKMAQDTDKLLSLATELKQAMDKSNKNEMSLDVIKKAEEIEHLAHDVKIRMKG